MQDLDLELYIGKWESGQMSSSLMASLYTVYLSSLKFGADFLQRKSSKSKKIDLSQPIISESYFIDLFENYKFKKMKPYVSEVLLNWLKGEWTMELITHIPSPTEVLELQAIGFRPVTMLVSSKRFFKPVLHKEDTLAFLTHDLEHAYKMNHDRGLFSMQVNFFRKISDLMKSKSFEYSFSQCFDDEQFKKDFDYLLSDMNTHPFHSLKFLKGLILSYFLRKSNESKLDVVNEAAYQELVKKMASLFFSDKECEEAFVLLNSAQFDEQKMPILLTRYFI